MCEEKDYWSKTVKYLGKIRERIVEEISNQEKEFEWLKNFDVKPYKGRNNRGMYTGIQFKTKDENSFCKYYLSMTSFDIDKTSMNVHTYPGRICIMVSRNGEDAGNPNKGVRCFREIAYYDTNNKMLTEFPKDGKKWIFDTAVPCRIYNTGYSIFSSESEKYIELSEEKDMVEFVRMVLSFIGAMEPYG